MGNTFSYQEKQCYLKLNAGAGTLRGVEYDQKARRFANIPYAKAPVGALRWRKPQPLGPNFTFNSPDGSPFDSTKLGQVCPQPSYSEGVNKEEAGFDFGEDCLRLNIWTPSQPPDDGTKYPVIIWLHGGWFQIGDPSHEISMNPVEFVNQVKAVFVSVGYRLNVFGFLTGKALLEENGGSGGANFGLWDQRLAMEWVYENISAFGGDPENIMLAGRSAGAYAVQTQVLYDFRGQMEESKRGHFQRIMMYSNAIPAQPKKIADCEEQFDELCDFFSIPRDTSNTRKLSVLRDIPSKDLVNAIMKLRNHTFRPVTDDEFIHDSMIAHFKSGGFAAEFKRRGLRLFMSEMLNEESLYGATNPPEPNLESLKLQISNYYAPDVTARLLNYYDVPTSKDKAEWRSTFGKIIADGQVRAPSRFIVESLVTHGVSINDIWRYLIAYRMSFITERIAPMSFGVTHAMDKPLWK